MKCLVIIFEMQIIIHFHLNSAKLLIQLTYYTLCSY